MSQLREALGLSTADGAVVIAEVAQAHDGSLGMAHAHIDAAAAAGADVVKFQTHIADAESTPAEPWRVKFSPQDTTRFEYWQRMEFAEDQWIGLRRHANEVGLGFMSSPFSPEAVELLGRVGVCGWKVASGEVTNLPLIEQMAATGQPVLLSSGMSSLAELDAAVACVRRRGASVAVFQCTTAYPTPADQVGLNLIPELADRYDLPVGLSDHSATVFAGLAAVTLGAQLLEAHLTLSPHMFGPDVPASLTVEQFAQLVTGVRFIETAMANKIDKDRVAADFIELRSTFQKSIVAARPVPAGAKLSLDDLALKKPGTGLPSDALVDLVGRTTRQALDRNTVLSLDHLEPTT